MKLKICGQNKNIEEVAALRPDYLGFIFWEPSSRYFDNQMPKIDPLIKKVGVFVTATVEEILTTVSAYNLDAIQLHGKESPEYCKSLSIAQRKHNQQIEIIKVFSIKNTFDFSILKSYEPYVDYFLFDTKGDLPGGNGYTFDWTVLQKYPSTTPFFLSGGIGIENVDEILAFMKTPESNYCYAVDINSKFEDEPGLKNFEKIKEFKQKLGSLNI
ncbi:N-(5'-phosphoribosyl)anthranilate isomerase [Croceivirga lutea]|uniref:phosphoribosylanthranilate isomerase n=1 Tax=Croceivirga lutea TaxID=1775167 RepID=UPI00163A6D30|nr:phosphoribosylanthranilate isomerase [Croceivirga lutea]GGG52295.1 N-(5'-phosphoribosyl)anthranilate isomerase [Croceivirga lutea]